MELFLGFFGSARGYPKHGQWIERGSNHGRGGAPYVSVNRIGISRGEGNVCYLSGKWIIYVWLLFLEIVLHDILLQFFIKKGNPFLIKKNIFLKKKTIKFWPNSYFF